ncbi:MAG: hypothetical protein ACHP9Z_28135, partial [Streptosporangiales bacterium]
MARAYLNSSEAADAAHRAGRKNPAAGAAEPPPSAVTLTQGSRWLTVHSVAFSRNGRLLASG